MKAQGFDNRFMMNVVGNAKKAGERAIGQLDTACFIQQQQTFGHAVEQRVLLSLELVERVKLNFLELLNFEVRTLLRLGETTAPPEMQKRQRRQSEKC